MEKAFVTFIIPSLGNKSLPNAIRSLREQTDPRWLAIVGFDHRDSTIKSEEKISVFTHRGYSDKGEDCPYCIRGIKSGAGPVRNECVARATTEWVAFLDDDDIVTNDYVEKLAIEGEGFDAVVFRLKFNNGPWIPPITATVDNIKHGSIGISMAVKRKVFETCQFTRGRGEDFRLFRDMRKNGFKIKISNFLTYFVRQKNADIKLKKEIETKLTF